MMPAGDLAAFQDAFACALRDPGQAMPPAFAVYRNTVMKGCVDALQANYPAVARLVGEDWFRAAAAAYARERPPRAPMLFEYGGDFDSFLAAFPPAAQLAYLPAVARLDRMWTEAHVARDEAPLDAAALARLEPERLGALRLRPHAAARWAWFALPAYSIWSRNRDAHRAPGGAPALEWRGEGALLTRPRDAVRWVELDAGGCAFLDACARGAPVASAASCALEAARDADLEGMMKRLLVAGAFADTTEERA